MINATEVIEALQAYRIKLKKKGQPAKAAAVQYCIEIVKRLAK